MKIISVLTLLLGAAVFSGCATNSELVRTCGKSIRGDVFGEAPETGPVPQGYTELLVISSLKTHNPGYHQSIDTHGTSAYRLLINIDGQTDIVSGRLNKENIEPRRLRDPEAGEGIRYEFRKNLRLKAGSHKIAIVIQDGEIAEERQISLPGGSRNSLVLEPVYGSKRSGDRMTIRTDKDFYEGIEGFRIILNGKTL